MDKCIGLFAVLQTLITQSDKDHPIKRSKITQTLQNDYDITIERRYFYRIRTILDCLGFSSEYDESRKGYYLDPPIFSRGEELMIWNAIHSARFLSQSESNSLLNKMNRFCSCHHYNEYRQTVYYPNPKKTQNSELMHNIEIAEEAIRLGKKMSFYYLHYNKELKLECSSNDSTVIEPRYIVYQDAKPYLIATGRKGKNLTHYRLDRMSNAVISSINSDPNFNTQDAYEYADNKLFMFSGPLTKVTIKCQKRILDTMVDLFGTEMILFEPDADHYQFSVTVNENGIVYLAQQFLDVIEIVEPETIRSVIQARLCSAYSNYLEC
ncbi:MAG: WYL domain-containing protein [Solobacterium sp.]|nr:WYL domain-containing protein [Solobacterium sp.]